MKMIEFNLTAVLQLLHFVFLLWILNKFVFKGFFEVLDKRREMIEGEIQKAEKIRKDAEEFLEQAEEKLRKVNQESQRLLEEAHKRAEIIVEEAREKAKREGERIITAAQEEAERIKQEAQEAIKAAAVHMALNLTARILKRQLDEKAQKELMEEALRMIKARRDEML